MEKELKLYQSLNRLANADGSVIFGDADDRVIPLAELKETFELQNNYYNRSFSGLSLSNSADLFDQCVAPLCPKDIYLHIGQNDLSLFEKEPSAFDQGYTSLIKHIRNVCKHCSLAIITLRNADNDPLIEQLNKHLAVISQNEGCELCDIAKQQAWNPRQTKEVVSFLYSMGFVRPLTNKRPVQDVARILFCYNLI